jgi:predicted transcriptional regulator
MARELADLVEAGLVKKTKSKSKGRMVYAAVACLEEQGYEMEGFVC